MSKGNGSGIVDIHGKQYQTVAYRVGKFREAHADWTLITEIVSRDEDCVVMKATISNDAGRVLATGHSEEYRASSQINRTSALENAETSAIGRALAALGMGGTEFASADEVANAIQQQRAPAGSAKSVAVEAFEALPQPKQKQLMDTAIQIRDFLIEERLYDAFEVYEGVKDNEEKLGLWSLLDSKQRSALKKAKDRAEIATQP